ncbi:MULTISPECIES: chemotaxis protein CheW [Okeania]|uniref:Chemotaxis protein CheW n=1 Tax=Okeania hirsuta TaxID=1458930 RepID=A0A3N6NYQ2_9CYAN|nr:MULTISPECIES: chemotaxis protein CheW [Okeania]NEP88802.1 chemotaxis protein CheW [Okeania sp. SIO2C2]NES75733.1 chemotaxis protein CheW [Okeania sp. SIO1H4]NES92651.1 chemotaxis protein CheW [Okeania sp. SIO2B9]NET19915.1 chemotaxis protein CheW [Okeania sp. SIO1H5]NET75422.1 chemotaxis protein CheW [Okeania sp. SIO1F9]
MVGNQDFLPGQGTGIQELENPEGELHLRFYLPSGNEFALPAMDIREVISQSPEGITVIPNVSPLLLGTINLRGRVIWVADLGQFLGDQIPINTDKSEIPVIAVEDQDTILGLAVERIVEMEWLDEKKLKMSTNIADGMAPFLKGEWIFDEKGEQVLRLLDQEAIIRSARWAA